MNLPVSLDWNWPELHDAFHAPEQYVTISAGRGSGKTRGGFLWLIEEMFEPEVESGLWVDVVQANIDSYVEEHLQRLILRDGWSLVGYDKQRKRLTLPGDRFIQFVSAERPTNAEGFRYHRTVLNEAGLILKKSSLWDNTLEPMTHPRDGVANKTRIIGTMKGKNRFHQLRNYSSSKWRDFHFPAHKSPNWTQEELDEIQGRIPEMVWRQEYMSEALDDAGSVFRGIGNGIKKPSEMPIDVLAIDLAKHEDFTVIIGGNRAAKQALFMDRFNQIDWGFQKNRIYNTWLKYGKPKVIIDSTGAGDPIYDDLRNAGMTIEGYKFTNQSKGELIQGLSVAMDNGEIFYPDEPVLIGELEVFGYDMTPSGNIRYNAPDGFHDDTVIALALFNYMIKNEVVVNFTWL